MTIVYESIDIALELSESLYMVRLEDSIDGFHIILKESKTDKKFKILFPPTYCYRNTNESYRLKTLSNNKDKLPDLLSIVHDSSFLKWFHDESLGVYMGDNLKHFMVFTGEEFIDVISHVEPEVLEIIE